MSPFVKGEHRNNFIRLIQGMQSGKFTQARHRLTIEGIGDCCLGVACQIAELPYTKRCVTGVAVSFYGASHHERMYEMPHMGLSSEAHMYAPTQFWSDYFGDEIRQGRLAEINDRDESGNYMAVIGLIKDVLGITDEEIAALKE